MREQFPSALKKSVNPKGKRIVQDNCPRQSSAVAKKALWAINAKLFKIPARSADINCIENLFAQITRELDQQAIDRNITKESKQEYEARIVETFQNFPVHKIDKLIESMSSRIDLIYKKNGKKVKY